MLGHQDKIKFFAITRNSPEELAAALNEFADKALLATTEVWNPEFTIVDKLTAYARVEVVPPAEVENRVAAMILNREVAIPIAQKMLPEDLMDRVQAKVERFRERSGPPRFDQHGLQKNRDDEDGGKIIGFPAEVPEDTTGTGEDTEAVDLAEPADLNPLFVDMGEIAVDPSTVEVPPEEPAPTTSTPA